MTKGKGSVKTRTMANEQLQKDIEELKAMQLQDFSDLKTNIRQLLKGQSQMQELINRLVEDNKRKDEQIEVLSNRVDELEQYTRRDDVLLSGLPTKQKSFAQALKGHSSQTGEHTPIEEVESLECQVLSFLKVKGIELHSDEISAIHPLKPKNPKQIPPIVIRLISRKTKERLMKNSFKLKNSEKEKEERKPMVFINEHLTTKNANIARMARELKKTNKIAGTWTRNGSVFIKKELQNGNMTVKVIKSVCELEQIK